MDELGNAGEPRPLFMAVCEPLFCPVAENVCEPSDGGVIVEDWLCGKAPCPEFLRPVDPLADPPSDVGEDPLHKRGNQLCAERQLHFPTDGDYTSPSREERVGDA